MTVFTRLSIFASGVFLLAGVSLASVATPSPELWIFAGVAVVVVVAAVLLAYDRFSRFGGFEASFAPDSDRAASYGEPMLEADIDFELRRSDPDDSIAIFGGVRVVADVVRRVSPGRHVILVIPEDVDRGEQPAIAELTRLLDRREGEVAVRLAPDVPVDGIVHIGRQPVLVALPRLTYLRERAPTVWLALRGALAEEFASNLQAVWSNGREINHAALSVELESRVR